MRSAKIPVTAEQAQDSITAIREELKVGQLVLVAPDLDIVITKQRLVGAQVHRLPERLTVYVSTHNLPLKFSARTIFGLARVGILTYKSPWVSSDLILLLRTENPAEARELQRKEIFLEISEGLRKEGDGDSGYEVKHITASKIGNACVPRVGRTSFVQLCGGRA